MNILFWAILIGILVLVFIILLVLAFLRPSSSDAEKDSEENEE
jgi:hypothetical protein